ncbi:MAG: beta-galactosidase [Kiritimatiellae bacterium]|nr:beta-galactosidase [Kiritimatiellia bacterium]
MKMRACGILLLAWFVTGVSAQAAETRPDLHAVLGERNAGVGLRVPSGGDGENVPEVVQGVSARRVKGADAHYLYVAIDHPDYRQGPVDVYVSAEAYDDGVSRVSLQYDKDAEHPNLGTCYTAGEKTYLLVGSGRWRTLHFFLPQLRLGHGQNHGADFRFAAPDIAFRKISVSPVRPAGFSAEQAIDPEALRQVAVARPLGMELTFGNDATDADAALFKALTVTSVESYVDWAGVEPERGKWDWSKWDKQVAVLKKAGLKWVPFLIAGPAYATPLWFQRSADSHTYRCLEHGKDSKVQSLFNPALRPQVERFLRAFAERYRDAGVIESVLLGVTGIYGESIYPAGPEGGWTARLTGDYHNHLGWWAGDAFAAAAFRRDMAATYGRVDRLNAAWGTTYVSFDDVTTFLPGPTQSDRARADFAEWYQRAMTDWAVFWVRAARKVFPKTEIYLCTGGDGNATLGADFTAQTAAIARCGAGVRITNEGSDYAHNFAVTREVATATRLYGTFCGFEPASKVDAKGVVARVYNATASGARQLHDYIPNTLGRGVEALENFRANAAWLTPRTPRDVRVALYLSRETWALEPEAVGRTLSLARTLRDATDLDFLTRRTLADGFLRQYNVLVLTASSVLEPGSAKTIEKWVRQGGLLIAATRSGETVGGRLYDHAAWRQRLFADAAATGPLLKPRMDGAAPAHWALRVGSGDDEGWLDGDWNQREKGREWAEIPDATMRWSGARPAVWLPVTPGSDHTLRISLSVPGLSLGKAGVEVAVNGQPVGRIAKAGRQECVFEVSADIIGSNAVARLNLAAQTWKPSERQPGNTDSRDLGVSVRQVEVFRAAAERSAPAPATLRMVPDPEALKLLTRKIGGGMTICLNGLSDDEKLVAALLPVKVDGRLDRRYATETDDGTLWLDADTARVWRGE